MDDKIENSVSHILIDRPESKESLRSAYHLTVPVKEAILSSKISLYVEETQQSLPDGGWGWLVVIGCFFINLIADGVSSTFGLLNKEFLEEFKASNSATSLIGSLFLSVPLLAGPLGSALVDRYGCKYMTIIGSIICSVGFIATAYVRTIWLMYITFGLISGIGFCFCFVPAVVSIAFWFEKRRTLALGIAAIGSGLGTVVYSPLLTHFLGEYGWRGAVLIMAGLSANMCISGLLMRDPDWIWQEERKGCKRKSQDKKGVISAKGYEIEEVKACIPKHDIVKIANSLMELPTFLHDHETVPLEVLEQLKHKNYNIIFENYPNLLTSKNVSDTLLMSGTSLHEMDPLKPRVNFTMKLRHLKDDDSSSDKSENSNKSHLKADHSHRHNYLKNIKVQKSNLGYRGAMLNIPKYKLASSSCPDFYRNSTLTLNEDDEDWYDDYVDILKDLTHISIFNDLHFFLLSLSTIIMCIWFVVPYFYLPVHMSVLGYTDNQASFVLSVIGLTNIIGMVILAVIGDKINAAKVYAVCLICCGVTCGFMMLFSNNYIILLTVSGLFGLFTSSCNSLQPSILADLVPLDKFTMAYGISLLCQGLGNLAGPPIAGLLFDVTQSYSQSFYQASFWIIFSGVLIGFIPYTQNKKIFPRFQ
ncbi:monocarboxylate transporter 14-like [Rhynchophorus ferrugineus]|uniref:monocarboxylate transporter 14-like n=1 Tax=Rhynchophorus ferrugineus TaxID=354439 RepID=UPI003FCE112C